MEQEITIIKHLRDLDTNKKHVQADHYMSSFTFNSGGDFYKKKANSSYYVYFFKVSPEVKKVEIRKNDVTEGLNETMRKWPIASFFHTSKDNPQFQDTKIVFPNEDENDPGITGIHCSRIGLNIIKTPFVAINEFKESIEMDVPLNFFHLDPSKDDLYFAVVSKLDPKNAATGLDVVLHEYDKNTYYITEYPVVEALYEGDPLARARVKFGKLMHNDEPVSGGMFIWSDCSRLSNKRSLRKVKKGKRDYQEYEAYFYLPKEKQTKELNPAFMKLFGSEDLDYFFNQKGNISQYYSALGYVKKHFNLIGKCKINVPVFKKTKDKDVLLWNQNCLIKPEEYYGSDFDSELGTSDPKNQELCTRHSKHPNLYDNFSLQEIYPTTDSFETTSPEEAAEKIARALMVMPRGHRSVSVEGSAFELLMGGPIQLADQLKCEKENVKQKDGESDEEYQKRKDEAEAKYHEEQILIKKKKNYLCSMVYFDDNQQKGLCGDGYIFYDAPTHYDNPKIKNDDEQIIGNYCDQLCKLYSNKNVRSEEKPDGPISGCEALQNLLDKVFDALKKRYHINVDYIYCDFEGMRNTANELGKHRIIYISGDKSSDNLIESTRDQVWESIWEAVKDRKGKETERYRMIYDKLEERGYAFEDTKGNALMLNNVKWCKHSTNQKWESSSGYNLSSTYAQRRNINIWDCVMMEYYAGLLDKYLAGPIRKHFPKAIRSLHAINNQAGYINHHQNGSEFETYLGGSVTLPTGMRSNPCLYTLKLDAFEKDSMDNWKTYIPEITPFARLIFDINNVRAAILSNPNEGIHPFMATQYKWNNYVINRPDDKGKTKEERFVPTSEQLNEVSYNACFQREMLIHSWMCKPEITYAYISYNDDTKHCGYLLKTTSNTNPATYEPVSKQDYLKEVFDDIQKTINELNCILNPCKKTKSLIQDIIPENSPFILSGWEIGKYQVYRITLEKYDDPKAFMNVQYLRKSGKGIFSARFSRLRKKMPLKSNLLASVEGKTVVFPNAFILKPEKGPGRWVVMKGSVRPYVLTERDYYEKNPSLDMQGCQQPVFQGSQEVSVLDNTSVFGEIARNQKWEATIKLGKTFNSNTKIFEDALGDSYKQYKAEQEYVFTKELDLNGTDVERPKKTLTIADSSNEVTRVKAIIQGANVQIDLYRESDGVNIGRVKNCRKTEANDKIILKVSWLNATNQDIQYMLHYNYGGSFRMLYKKKILARSGDEGYVLIPLKPTARAKSINASILQDGVVKDSRSAQIG
ncbi:MAG: hypothetical protein IK017_08225 [Paludibacteraceae bacterium]|nr:hypothetical protein [Paludibacteraceae bacterium]